MNVVLIDKMGSDLTIVNAARVSYNKDSKWDDELNNTLSEKDEKLIRFLAKQY